MLQLFENVFDFILRLNKQCVTHIIFYMLFRSLTHNNIRNIGKSSFNGLYHLKILLVLNKISTTTEKIIFTSVLTFL